MKYLPTILAGTTLVIAAIAYNTMRTSPEAPEQSGAVEQSAHAQAMAATDRRIAFHDKRANQRKGSWLDLQLVANGYLGRAHLTGSYDDYANAERAIERAFANAPTGSGPFLTRARFNFAVHRFDQVEADLTKAASAVIVTKELARSIAELSAALAFQVGDYEQARTRFAKLLDEKRTVTALARMAQIHWKTGDFGRAESLFQEAVARTPKGDAERLSWLELMRGLLDLDRGRYADALAHYRAADAHFPGWYLIQEHVAEIEALEGRLPAAKLMYETLVAETQNPEFMGALAGVLQELGDKEGAQRMITQASRVYELQLQSFPEAAYGHAFDHFLEHGDSGRAVELAQKNRELRPGGEALIKLAQAHAKAGNSDQAVAVIEEVMAGPYKTVELFEVAAEIYEARGDVRRARKARDRAEALKRSV